MQVKQSKFIMVLLGILAVGLLLVIANVLVWYHLNATTVKYTAEYFEKTTELTKNAEDIDNLHNDQTTLDDLTAELATLDKNLADYRYVPTYLVQITDATARTHNGVNSISPGIPKPLDLTKGPFAEPVATPAPGTPAASGASSAPPANAAGAPDAAGSAASQYQVLSISLDLTGSYAGILQLLDEFRRFPKMIYVRDINMNPVNVNGKNLISAKLETYAIITPDQYQPRGETLPSVGMGGRL